MSTESRVGIEHLSGDLHSEIWQLNKSQTLDKKYTTPKIPGKVLLGNIPRLFVDFWMDGDYDGQKVMEEEIDYDNLLNKLAEKILARFERDYELKEQPFDQEDSKILANEAKWVAHKRNRGETADGQEEVAESLSKEYEDWLDQQTFEY